MRVRIGTPNPPIIFELRRTGPETTGVLGGIAAKDLQADLAAADALFNQQKWDEAVAAYRAIMTQGPDAHRHQSADRGGVPEQEGF